MRKEAVIYQYTRTDALNDGALVDVTETAKEAGFRWPVAVSAGLWALLQPTEKEAERGQSLNGRLWDLLMVSRFVITSRRGKTEAPTIESHISVAREGTRGMKLTRLDYLIALTATDDGGPALTLYLPGED